MNTSVVWIVYERPCTPAVLDATFRRVPGANGPCRRGTPMFRVHRQPVRYVPELLRDLVSGRYRGEHARAFHIAEAVGAPGILLVFGPSVTGRSNRARRAWHPHGRCRRYR